MNWARITIAALVLATIGAVGAWGYGFFVAPESVEAVSDKWAVSGHADADSESFVYWAEDEPPEIPERCAKCHSMDGYIDFVGADGSAAGQVDSPVLGVSILGCRTCHTEPAHEMTEVRFPSGIVVEEPTQAANCMQCHQGRRSTPDVNETLAGLELDVVSEDLSFINVHYAVPAATLWGDEVQVAYQYSGESYVGRFGHVEDYDTCIECHDAHTLFRNPDECSPCHLNVVNEADLREIRTSEVDYDGDGDVEEPIFDEIETLHEGLYAAIQTYAEEVIGEPIIYDGDTFPYFFNDPDGGEVTFADQYASWTPRLVRTTYNYHYIHEDRGAYTHNARYAVQVLYDSMEDLAEVVSVDMEGFVRP